VTAAAESLERAFREDSARALATLIRLLGDFDLAEEALQDAFATAVAAWRTQGVPASPRAWLVAVARRRAIDRLRRAQRFEQKARQLVLTNAPVTDPGDEPATVEDDRLRLIFTCCHPALAREAQVALTLRAVCGLATEEIARAFLVSLTTMAQRLVRAKAKIRAAAIPYAVPGPECFDARLDSVLAVVYLIFNEGYAATAGEALLRRELCQEAQRLGRLLVELGAGRAEWREAEALLALMLLHDARREARSSADGALVLLEDQDRSRWDRARIAEGVERVEHALRAGPAGAYALQAAIAALHARAERPQDTDWRQIAALYGLLLRVLPTPVVELNRAVAVAMVDGPERGLLLLDALDARGALRGYHLLPAARADLLRRLGRVEEARAAYRAAARLATLEPERRFLEARAAAD
jgi:RNA polymerase sigma-70 factor (ECF subfamily)